MPTSETMPVLPVDRRMTYGEMRRAMLGLPVVGVRHKPGKKRVELTLTLIRADIIRFKRSVDADKFAEVMTGVIGR